MVRLFLELTKFRLSAAVSVSTVVGFILGGGEDSPALGYSTLAVLLLALGVSALNQYQEWEKDMLMERTRERPIPSGCISPTAALLISMLLIVLALWLIYSVLGYTGLLIFLFVPLWYNGLYTSLKRYSAFAVVPGGLLGVIPLAIGWLAAEHSLTEPKFLALGVLFFVWQVPHFWLLAAKYDEEYRAAGFPTAVEVFGPVGFRKVLFVWWMLTVLCAIFASVIFRVQNTVLLLLLVIVLGVMVFTGSKILFEDLTRDRAGAHFKGINIFLSVIMVLLCMDSMI
jgi:protoheme IX farnesyltransferase